MQHSFFYLPETPSKAFLQHPPASYASFDPKEFSFVFVLHCLYIFIGDKSPKDTIVVKSSIFDPM
jgi:hypothetical protein